MENSLTIDSSYDSRPLVSVIIASFNHGAYIEDSIRSVLAQSYQEIELFVVDDGSSDDSVERILKLQDAHGFDFVVQKNKGLSRTLNETVERAHGTLIAPFGSDDVMLPTRLALQVAYMQGKPEVGICAGNIDEIDASGKVRKHARDLPMRRLNFDDVFLNRKAGAPAPTFLFRREALAAAGGFNPQIRLEDLYIQLKVTHAGYFVDVLPEVLSLYRVHGSNTYKNYRFMVDNVLRTYGEFQDHPAYEEVCNRFLNSMLLKSARNDKALARDLLKRLPPSAWDKKTLRALWRMILPARRAD